MLCILGLFSYVGCVLCRGAPAIWTQYFPSCASCVFVYAQVHEFILWKMLYLSKNSIFNLKYSHGNHIHDFENTYYVHDYFGSKHPAIKDVTLFTV